MSKKKPKLAVPYDENQPDICVDGDEHTPDPNGFTQADGAAWIVDVKCQKCGRSGSAPVSPSDIQW